MAEIFKEIKTRIALKANTYEYWTTGAGADYVPLYGEVCFCEIPSANPAATTAPTVLFKVGTAISDGQGGYKTGTGKKFSELSWTSALAADVYSWAKKTQAEFETWVKTLVPLSIDDKQTGKFVTGVSVNGQTITITRSNIAYSDISGTPTIPTVNNGKLSLSAGAGLSATEKDFTANSGTDVTFTIAHGAKPATGTAQAATAGSGRTYVTEVTVDAYGHVAGVKTATETADPNTAHTHSAGDGLKLTGAGGISGDTKYELNLGLKLEEGNIVLHDKTNTTKVIATLDAAELLEDSYLNDVEIVGNELQFTWKMDDGSTKTDSVDLTHLVDTYTANNAAGAPVVISVSGYKISADLSETVKAQLAQAHSHANKAELDKFATGDKTKLDTAVQTATFAGAALTKTGTALAITKEAAATALGLEALAYKDEAWAASTITTKFNELKTAQGLLSEITTTANGGLKVTNKNKVDIDTEVVFVLNCNY